MRRIKLFEEFSGELDKDDFLLDLFTMSSTEVNDLFFEELRNKTPNLEKIEVMLESGLVDVRAKNNWGNTPLHLAVWSNHIEIAKLLLKAGADVEAINKYGNTPLHSASYNNSIETAKLLIKAGADLDAKNKWEETPLHLAQSDEMRALLGGGL
jgi:ankyrin repeat protein